MLLLQVARLQSDLIEACHEQTKVGQLQAVVVQQQRAITALRDEHHHATAEPYVAVDQIQQQGVNTNPKARAGWKVSSASPHTDHVQHDAGLDRSMLSKSNSMLSKLTENFASRLSQVVVHICLSVLVGYLRLHISLHLPLLCIQLADLTQERLGASRCSFAL